MGAIRVVLMNCFLLIVPILLLNLLLTGRLPQAMFARDLFWHDIPPVIAYGENTLRVALLAVPLLIPLRWRPVGLAVYAAGLAAYAASWVTLIGWPDSAWSASAAGLLAPAYTPIAWAVGIGLIGQPRLGRHTAPGWLYPACAACPVAYVLHPLVLVVGPSIAAHACCRSER